MDRGSLARWLLLGAGLILFFVYGMPLITGEGSSKNQPLSIDDSTVAPGDAPEEVRCTLRGPRFEAEVGSRGASLRSTRMLDRKYVVSVDDPSRPIDLVTTTRPERMPLRTDLRIPGLETQQVPYNVLDWKLASSADDRCVFRFESAEAELEKTFSTTGRPFEISVELRVKNRASEPRKHRLAVEQTAWRTAKEEEGRLGMQSEFLTEAVLHAKGGKTQRLMAGDFEPDDFEGERFTKERWYRAEGEALWVATSSSYFAQAVIHREGPAPAAEAQIEEVWRPGQFASKKDDPLFGHVYRTRLAYPERELAAGEEASYAVLAFLGPKERHVLAQVGGGAPDAHETSQLVNLGWFGVIGRVLVGYVYWLHAKVGSWGWSIVLLTVTVKMLLFPLTLPQIKSSFHMRRLKPQMDALNERYKEDPTQRGLALQELWRKEGVTNPMLGCLPVLLQMPVWIALYTALQTEVELYHTPFGPFMPDLSQPGKYFIIPAVLGASSFLQQKLMPAQGDPAQQKMMMFMMPAIFTVMMLFLPAGLGVYMITNTWLGITQQLFVERWMKTKLAVASPRTIEVRDKVTASAAPKGGTKDDDAEGSADAPATSDGLGKKGKARGRGRDARIEDG